MAGPRASRGNGAARATLPPSPPAEHSMDDVARLGEALKQRAADVLEQTVARTIGSGEVVDPLVQESFERICTSSTMAVARWIAGEGLEVTSAAALESSQIFGELAARRAASLNEGTRRSPWWRHAGGGGGGGGGGGAGGGRSPGAGAPPRGGPRPRRSTRP